MKHSLKKIGNILAELSYAQLVALKNSDLKDSVKKLFSFLKRNLEAMN